MIDPIYPIPSSFSLVADEARDLETQLPGRRGRRGRRVTDGGFSKRTLVRFHADVV